MYIIHILILATAYITICAGSYLMIRGAGAVSLGQGALVGTGAYAIAIGSGQHDLPYMLSLFIGVIVAFIASLVLAHLSIRLQGDYLVISTLSFQLVLYEIAVNLTELTNGPMGIAGVPRPEFLFMSFSDDTFLFLFSTLLAIVALVVTAGLKKTPFGNILAAVKEQPTIALATGYSVSKIKIQVCALGGIFAGIGGAIIASTTRFVDPSSISFAESILVLSIVVLAGNRAVLGILFGVFVVIVIPEFLRFIGFSAPIVGYARGIAYGILLILAARSTVLSLERSRA